MEELSWQLHGSRTRHADLQSGVRQIWVYLHNYLHKNKYRTPEAVSKVWPLYTDKNFIEAPKTEEDMRDIFRELKSRLEAKNASNAGTSWD